MKRAFNCEQRSTEAHLAIEQSIPGLQQREAEMFYHITFRPKLLFLSVRLKHQT